MADRRDIDDVKLTAELMTEEEELDLKDIKDSDLSDDLGDLGDLDLDLKNLDENPILEDDDFSDPPVSRRKKKKTKVKGKSSMTMMMLVSVVIALVVGGVFFAMNKDVLMRAISAVPAPPKNPLPVAANDTEPSPTYPSTSTDTSTPPTTPIEGVTPVNQTDVAATVPVDGAALMPPETPIDAAVTSPVPSADNPTVMPAVDPAQSQAPSDTSLQPAPTPTDTPPQATPVVAADATKVVPTPVVDPTASTTPVDPSAPAVTPADAPVVDAAVTSVSTPAQDMPPVTPVAAEATPAVTVAPTPVATTELPQPTPAPVVAPAVNTPADASKDDDMANTVIPETPEATTKTAKAPVPSTEPTVTDDELAALEHASAPPLPPALPPGKFYESSSVVNTMSENITPKVASSVDAAGRMTGVEVTVNNGQNMDAQILAGSRALDLERYDAAYDIFDELYQTNRSDERILMGRAVALQKLGRNAEAITAYDELLAKNPDSPEVMTNMLGLVRQQYPSEALQRLLDLRLRYPNNPVVAAQAGLANASVGNYEEGLRYLGIAAGLDPHNPKHFFNMAVIAERMGKPDMAITYYERALEADALATSAKNKLDRDMVYDRLSVLRQGK